MSDPGAILSRLDEAIIGKSAVTRLALACLLARGHLLLEDVPGVGKTTLALGLARVLGLGFRRVQFTADLLPGDIVGAEILDGGHLVFRPGPVFCQVVLADEINRAPPRTQSALLEAMEERQVTAAGATHPLPDPFLVIATANPLHQGGTFALPESQLDRFLMRLSLGMPDRDAERVLLEGGDRRPLAQALAPVADAGAVVELQRRAGAVHVAPAVREYLLDVVAGCRDGADRPLSPRAALALQAATRGHALVAGRDHAVPHDVQVVAAAVLAHRLGERGAGLVAEVLARTAVRI
jgi:MoxR-like ATPase